MNSARSVMEMNVMLPSFLAATTLRASNAPKDANAAQFVDYHLRILSKFTNSD